MRSFVISRRQAGQPLAAILQAQLRISQADALECVRGGGVRLGGNPCTDPNRRVRSGQRVQVTLNPKPVPRAKAKPERRPAPVELPPAAREVVIRYLDEHLLIVEKPPGLTTVRHAEEAEAFGRRAKRFLPPTLADLLPVVLQARGVRPRGRVRAVHRLDKETSGLVAFALTAEAERHLGRQFRAHGVGRHYLALVRGRARDERIESSFVRDRGDGRRGAGADGQRAVTHVRVVEDLGDFTLVECRLETGRTHQVRIHLGERGTPLCGERVYDRPVHGHPLPDASGARRPMLHAASLAVVHPATGQRLEWESPPPEDMRRLLRRLRRPSI
jgi:23S rRNA pseudouridine1911/1915/1917 synthase